MITMNIYHKSIINKLLAIYERWIKASSSFSQRVMININENHFKEYFKNEDNYIKALKELESINFISLEYERYRNIISRVILNIELIDDIYNFCGKKNINENIKQLKKAFSMYGNEIVDMIRDDFNNRQKNNKSIAKFLDKDFIDVLKILYELERNEEETFERNFSLRLFGDSKRLVQLKKNVLNYYEEQDIFKQKGVLRNPSHLLVKGDGLVKIYNQTINLNEIKVSIGLEIDNINNVEFFNISSVTTIENLTTFHDYKGKGLIIYLGGFSNNKQRKILLKLKETTSNFYHFGDIDYGGYSILDNLMNILNINIKTLHMNLDTLIKYRDYAQKIPKKNYIKKLKTLLDKPNLKEYYEVISYMIKEEIWLEQESLYI